MPKYLPPGVYVEEIKPGAKPIEGVATSTAAFVGETERGATTPRLITSYKEYERWFGGTFGASKFMPYAVQGFFENGGNGVYICRVASSAATPAELVLANFTIRAKGPGSWGQRVYATVEPSSTTRPGVQAEAPPVPAGFRLRLAYYGSTPKEDPVDWFLDPSNEPFPDLHETFDDLEMDAQSPNYWRTRLRGTSALVEVVHSEGGPGEIPARVAPAPLSAGGLDGSPELDAADFEGLAEGLRRTSQGLAAIEADRFCDVSLVYAPGVSAAVSRAVIDHCERLRFRFAVVDPEKRVDVDGYEPRVAIKDSMQAALYYPWIAVLNPQTGAPEEVPPGGHVLGVYARTDAERGVFKAPANEVLRGATELLAHVNDQEQAMLNPRGVNAIRQFPDRGILVWGARTLSSNSLWKYVNVRRLFIFLERSIYEGTEWVVFEPNDDGLWKRVEDNVRLFLHTQWRAGALAGRTEEEAFFVTCDRTTMTKDDILNGRLICEIGVAPVRPAEFVIFRIFQKTAEAPG